MAVSIKHNTRLDQAVVRYLAEPVPLTEIQQYTVTRMANGVTVLDVKIIMDSKRFDKEHGNG